MDDNKSCVRLLVSARRFSGCVRTNEEQRLWGCAAVGYLASNKTNSKASNEHQDQQANGEADANPLPRVASIRSLLFRAIGRSEPLETHAFILSVVRIANVDAPTMFRAQLTGNIGGGTVGDVNNESRNEITFI